MAAAGEGGGVMDPMTIAALMQGAGVLAGGLKAPPAAPANSMASQGIDNSGWNVNFGSGSISSAAEKRTGSNSSEWLILAMVLVGGLVVMKVLK